MTTLPHSIGDYLDDQAPCFYLVFDENGLGFAANRFTTALIGNVVGKSFKSIFVDFSGRLDLAEMAADPSKFHRLDVTTLSDLPQTLLCSFRRVADGIIAIGHVDILEMQVLQRSFIELNNELNVVMRQLQKANAQLEKLNALKNRFVGFAAHDLRRPVGVILSYTEFLQAEARDRLTPEHGEFLDIIQSRAESMNRLVEDLLDIATIESGRNEPKLETTDLADIFRTVEFTLKRLTTTKQVTLETLLDPSVPRLKLDVTRIEQAILNLAENAVEHTRPGTIVRLQARRDGGNILVTVSDAGPGIPAAKLGNLFQPFARGATGKDSHGLGLAIAKRMIDSHRGRIWVESQPGEGTTFFFTLPITLEPDSGRKEHS